MSAEKDRGGGVAGRPLFARAFAELATLIGIVLGIITIPGAVYLTFWRWDTAWPWVLIPVGSWLLMALLRRYVIGENLLLVAIPASMIYGVIGFVLLVGAIL